MALGIIACGSSIGGTVFPIAFRNLVATVGYVPTLFFRRIPGGSHFLSVSSGQCAYSDLS